MRVKTRPTACIGKRAVLHDWSIFKIWKTLQKGGSNTKLVIHDFFIFKIGFTIIWKLKFSQVRLKIGQSCLNCIKQFRKFENTQGTMIM